MTTLAKPDGGVRGIVVGDCSGESWHEPLRSSSHHWPRQPHTHSSTHSPRAQEPSVWHTSCRHCPNWTPDQPFCQSTEWAHLTTFPGPRSSGEWRTCHGDNSFPVNEVGENVDQGEGGEQGDPLMPLSFSLGQHRALVAVNAELQEGEWLMAFLDDVHVTRTKQTASPCEKHADANKGLILSSRARTVAC